MRGRKPKPVEIRALEGNPGKRPIRGSSAKSWLDEMKRKKQVKKCSAAVQNQGPGKNKKAKQIKKEDKQEIGKKRQQNGGVVPGTPLCPAWIDATAKREWRRIAPVLKRLGLLTVVDRTALAGYCQAYARWRQAEMTVTTQGIVQTNVKSGRSEASPEVRVAQRYLEICKNFCVEFGMTPSARGRMVLPAEKEEADEFEEILD